MEITCIADLHGFLPELPGGDLLIVAGDLTARHTEREFYDFSDWIRSQEYEDKIVIGGNHDTWINLEADAWDIDNWCDTGEFEYLCDSGTELENGLKIWGTPWTLTFPGINPRCTAFTGTEEELATKFAMIPNDIDILISHGPPFAVFDTVRETPNSIPISTGSISLSKELMRIIPKLHIFGHIHEHGGKSGWMGNIQCVNCSHVNEHYKPVNKPVRIIL